LVDLTHVKELASLGKVVHLFNHAAHDFVDRSLVVGATARDLILHHVHDLPITRATVDLDIAVAVRSWEVFDRLERQIIAEGGRRDPKVRHRFFAADWKIDVVPFGQVEADGVIIWPDTHAEMIVAGFDEASTHAVQVILPGGVPASVASPPALLMLKLIAWEDRHLAQPRHDALDIRTLIDSYAAPWNEDRLYDDADDLLVRFGYDNALAAAALLAHDAASIARPATAARIRKIIERETSGDTLVLAADMGRLVEDNLAFLEAVRIGFQDTPLT
jgi:predicted nucleotidyltransferase